jgi:hypothetical protein
VPGGERLDLDRVVVPTRWTRIGVTVRRRGSAGAVVVAPAPLPEPSFEVRVEPESFDLGDGAEREVAVYLRARPFPADANPGAPPKEANAILRVGENEDDPHGNTLALMGLSGADSDGDGVADTSEQQQGRDFDGNGDGVPDFRQREVASFPVSLYHFTLVFDGGGVLGGIEPLIVLGKDVPLKEFAPYGGWRIGLQSQAGTLPRRLELFTGHLVSAKLRHLMVLDEAGHSQPRTNNDEKRRAFELQHSSAEQRRLQLGDHAIAPTGTY